MGRPKKTPGDFKLPEAPVVTTPKAPLFSGSLDEHVVFKWIMMQLQSKHPMWTALPPDASVFTRASHQIKCEAFQAIIADLWTLAKTANSTGIESTYGTE